MGTQNRYRTVVAIAIMAMGATSCLGGDGGDDAGGTVEVLGAFSGAEGELYEESFAAFEEETGIDVSYEGVTGFETLITTRVQGGDLPDIAIFPQPGLLLDIAGQAEATPLSEIFDLAQLEEALIPGFLDAAVLEGEPMGLPMRMAVKSILWYPVPEFEEAGYALPQTQEELAALSEQMIADGNTPWCLGIESGDATGWVGTDWVEEYMLRLHGPEAYDKWVNHELLFDSPEVTAAWEAFGNIWMPEGAVNGGAQAILATPFGDAPNGMFEDPPKCWMHRQGNFITGFFPDDVQADLDSHVGAAYFPQGDGYDGKPVLAGGDLALLLKGDNEAAVQFMQFMGSNEFGGPWAEAGGWLSPYKGFDDSLFPNDVTREVYRIATEADVLRFDASDLMPGAVGAGSFWTGMVNWISGEGDLQAVLSDIDQSWPASEGGSDDATTTTTAEEDSS